MALHGAPPAYAERGGESRCSPSPTIRTSRLLSSPQPRTFSSHCRPDPKSGPTGAATTFVPAIEAAGARTLLLVPMLKEDELIGGIVIYRQEVRPFTDKQIELVTNFANAGRHRDREHAAAQRARAKSLQQQTATSEVLQVISSSPGELEPVFQAMLENATRICEANVRQSGAVRRCTTFATSRALHGAPAAFEELRATQSDCSHRQAPLMGARRLRRNE